jgi:hypothetical protein
VKTDAKTLFLLDFELIMAFTVGLKGGQIIVNFDDFIILHPEVPGYTLTGSEELMLTFWMTEIIEHQIHQNVYGTGIYLPLPTATNLTITESSILFTA